MIIIIIAIMIAAAFGAALWYELRHQYNKKKNL